MPSTKAGTGCIAYDLAVERRSTVLIQATDNDAIIITPVHSWFGKWAAYSGYTISALTGKDVADASDAPLCKAAPRPGPIDNSDLLCEDTAPLIDDDPPQIDAAATEHTDYVVLTADAWRKLHGWYGGGPELPRPVILEGFITKIPVVAAHPYCLTVHHAAQKKTILVPKQSTMAVLKQRACKAVGVEEVDVKMWDYHQRRKNGRLDTARHIHHDCIQANVLDKQDILLVRPCTKITTWHDMLPHRTTTRTTMATPRCSQPDDSPTARLAAVPP